MIIYIPFVPEKLRPEVREVGEWLGARFADVPALTSYWDLVAELWNADSDFVLLEEDVLPTDQMIRSMWECEQPWCSGTYGRWWWEKLCAPTKDAKPCGEPPGRCGVSAMTDEKAARIAACPLRSAGRTVLRSDSWLGCVKFGSIRRQFPDLLARAAGHFPRREWYSLDRAMWRILYDEELVSPHLHFPAMDHIKMIPGSGPALPYRHVGDDGLEVIDPPWDRERYERDLAEIASS